MERLVQRLIRQDEVVHPIIESIRSVCERMDVVQSQFEVETDPDLIEATIYELQSLRARYRYLLKTARKQGITSRERESLWNE